LCGGGEVDDLANVEAGYCQGWLLSKLRMKVYADAIVTNHLNQALFILRNDSRTWAQPGGAVEEGELPTEAVAREVKEETGIEVKPVRLVAVYYRPERPDGSLSFSFRCLQEGGELKRSRESPGVGFMGVYPPPTPILGMHRDRLERALQHDGGPPYWGFQQLPAVVRAGRWLVYGVLDLKRALTGEVAYRPPPEWTMGAFVVVRDEEGSVLWVRRRDHDVWNLPGGRSERAEPPWETAVREAKEETGLDVRLSDLTGVYSKPAGNHLILTFAADVVGGRLTASEEAGGFDYFAPGEEPANAMPKHVTRVADAVGRGSEGRRQETVFREQAEPPTDLAALAARGDRAD